MPEQQGPSGMQECSCYAIRLCGIGDAGRETERGTRRLARFWQLMKHPPAMLINPETPASSS
jgi:hypothetical protein